MNAYKKLIKNSGIFAIANMGSKLISILLVPYYTYVLTTEQYGRIDMLTTSISLILPIITASIFDATLRFATKSEYDEKSIFSSSILVVILGNMIFLLLYPLIKRISLVKDFEVLFYLILIMQSCNTLCAQFSRGIGRIKQFALNGVIYTVITVVLNIFLLSKFNMGIQGYLISIIIGYTICNIYLIISIKLWEYISYKAYDKNLVKEMLKYSIPLIPNTLMWWVMNASDRYAIAFFMGVSANGIYAIANKIPTVLNVLYSIFSQAWQLSAIEESESRSKSKFYTDVFNVFSVLMILATSIIIVFVRPLVESILSVGYINVWRYVPLLLLAVVFTSYSSFLGTNYIAMKDTRGVFITSLIGAILNIILNLILIPRMGLNGAALATMVSFFIVWIIRIYDTRKFVTIKMNLKSLFLSLFIIFSQIDVLYIYDKYYIIVEIGLLVLLLLVNKNIFKFIIKNIITRSKKTIN